MNTIEFDTEEINFDEFKEVIDVIDGKKNY